MQKEGNSRSVVRNEKSKIKGGREKHFYISSSSFFFVLNCFLFKIQILIKKNFDVNFLKPKIVTFPSRSCLTKGNKQIGGLIFRGQILYFFLPVNDYF